MKYAIRYYSKFGHSEQMAQVVGEILGVKPESVETPLTEEVDTLFIYRSRGVLHLPRIDGSLARRAPQRGGFQCPAEICRND